MRVRSLVNLQLFEDTTQRDTLFGFADETQTFTFDNFTEEHSDRFRIDALGSLSFGLGSIAACRGLYIRALGDFDLTLNGAAVPIAVRRWPGAAATVPCKFYFDGVVTSVSITNISATALLEGNFALWGDAA